MSRLILPIALALGVTVAAAGPVLTSDIDPPTLDAAPPDTILVGDASMEPPLPLDGELALALGQRKHSTAARLLDAIDRTTLHGHQLDDHAFLLAWSLLRAGKKDDAVALIDIARVSDHAPPAYKHLLMGELLLAGGDPIAAMAELSAVPTDAVIHARAQLALADAQQAAGATADAVATWEALAARPDPAEGTPLALNALATKAGLGSERAYPHLRRLWSEYPLSAEGRQAAQTLPSHEAKGSAFRATQMELARRGDALMRGWRFKDATDLLGPNMARFETPNEAACIAWYAFGRSHFKRANVTKAAEVLTPAGKKCVGIDDDRGAKSLYIAGKSLERKKMWGSAAKVYALIPALYPNHTMADDGHALAGIGFNESGDPAKAREHWTQQVDDYPEGDLAAEGFWRLAWGAYQRGEPQVAIDFAERMVREVPEGTGEVHRMAARYWAARWRVYPDVAAPTILNADAEAVAEGIDLWVQLCTDAPTRFYSLLASSRLSELAPERLAPIPRPAQGGTPDSWTVRAAFMDAPATQRAFELTRMGLIAEARAELNTLPEAELTPSEFALRAGLHARTAPIEAHDSLHHYLLDHPPVTLTHDRDRILRTAYPDIYWDEVQEAAEGYGYDPRIFHSLVREESSFNKDIVSHAGARGLSQLMPATARTVAGWMGMKVDNSKLSDPLTNLRIGSRYLDYLRGYFDGNMFLAVAAYNAGEGNVGKWLKARGDIPTDEFIEHIPFRETRHYVKRVLGTYMLYRATYGPDSLYPDWSDTNHSAHRR